MHCGYQRHLGLCLGYVPALAYGSCRVSYQGTTLRASDLHNARATILNPFNTFIFWLIPRWNIYALVIYKCFRITIPLRRISRFVFIECYDHTVVIDMRAAICNLNSQMMNGLVQIHMFQHPLVFHIFQFGGAPVIHAIRMNAAALLLSPTASRRFCMGVEEGVWGVGWR